MTRIMTIELVCLQRHLSAFMCSWKHSVCYVIERECIKLEGLGEYGMLA